MSFPERLMALQKERRVDKKEVYKAAGLSRAAYYFYETGAREPTLSKLTALADYFDVSTDYLAGRSNTPTRLP